MKVLKISDKNSNIKCYGKNIFKTTENYLNKFPKEYSNCYYKNLETLKLIRTSRIDDTNILGIYKCSANTILYLNNIALGHELFHMASNNCETDQCAFQSALEIESGLIEGMTEYHMNKAYNFSSPTAYEFETFCVMMLENIPDIFKSYFIPNEGGIYNLFSDKKTIYSLIYSIDYYSEYMNYIYSSPEDKVEVNIDALRKDIRDIIDSLINIELSFSSTPDYDTKFLDLFGSMFIADTLKDVYPNYFNYANKQINKKVRKLV